LSSLQAAPIPFPDIHIPFDELSRQLTDTLDIGAEFLKDSSTSQNQIPEAQTSQVLDSVGQDLLIFLFSSVVVTLGSTALNISPILGYLVAGALLGPHGLDVFSNAKADVELGDFGILFLLFSEGLEVSSARLKKLSNYLPLGFAQISLTTGVITAAILLGAPQFLDRFLPLDEGFIDIRNPTEAVVLALAGTLSTSAFIFPVLKERGWEGENSGQAATSILLLQDLFVAPLLVVLPYVVGQGPTDFVAIGFLTAKAAIGFGLVMYVGSFLLQRLFGVVAQTRSTETFVALSLLVSVGMGAVAQSLGLTDTAGAFAAGVLLANTNFRAQIQADVLPFKGILLGIFFMDGTFK
jgi:Kef-type K+ transport system membrane component KefB